MTFNFAYVHIFENEQRNTNANPLENLPSVLTWKSRCVPDTCCTGVSLKIFEREVLSRENRCITESEAAIWEAKRPRGAGAHRASCPSFLGPSGTDFMMSLPGIATCGSVKRKGVSSRRRSTQTGQLLGLALFPF